MLSARQLLLMRRTRDRAIDIAIAHFGTVIFPPDPDVRRRVFRCVSHVGLSCVARQVGRMDRARCKCLRTSEWGHEPRESASRRVGCRLLTVPGLGGPFGIPPPDGWKCRATILGQRIGPAEAV